MHLPLPKDFNIIGIQGQLWSETIRSEQQAEYMLFPRLIAMAERAWHHAEWAIPYNYQGAKYNQHTGVFTKERKAKRDQQWMYFSNAIAQKELIKLDKQGVFYRVPTPGAKIIDGTLHMNCSLPGLPLEYRDSSKGWTPYTQPVPVTGTVQVRAKNAMGNRPGRSLTVQ